jgi:tetratricopeptide (TPR) repeat protein
LAAASTVDDPVQRINAQVAAQLEVGDVLLSGGDFERARVEYQEAFQYPARDRLEWRSTIQVHIADSYMKEKKYPEAVAAYEKAQKIGLYGWRTGRAAPNRLTSNRPTTSATFSSAEAIRYGPTSSTTRRSTR